VTYESHDDCLADKDSNARIAPKSSILPSCPTHRTTRHTRRLAPIGHAQLTPVGLTIFRSIQAIDRDKPNTANSDVTYSIVVSLANWASRG
jgi:hypothetical protein